MVAIRLTRTGAKKRPSYRVIVTDSRRPRDSKNIEIVGHYNPRPDPIELALKRERIAYWLGVGAQPSDTVKRLIRYFDEHGATAPEAKKAYEPQPVEKTAGEMRAEMTASPVEEEAAEATTEAATAEPPESEAEAASEAAAETASEAADGNAEAPVEEKSDETAD